MLTRLVEETQTSNAGGGLAGRLRVRCSEEVLVQLGQLLTQMQARFPQQTLGDEATDAWLDEAERLTVRYGLETFTEALGRACEAGRFMPHYSEVERHCEALNRVARQADATKQAIRKIEDSKRVWLREWLEDTAAGIARKPLAPELAKAAEEMRLLMVQADTLGGGQVNAA